MTALFHHWSLVWSTRMNPLLPAACVGAFTSRRDVRAWGATLDCLRSGYGRTRPAGLPRRTAARHQIAGSAAGIAAALAAVVLFGATVVLQASLHRRGVSAMSAVGLRYAVSAVVCAAILAARRRSV